MPSRKASELEPGLVLIDPAGKLYEIMAVDARENSGVVHVWLWPDTSSAPDAFQTFTPNEEINFISQNVMEAPVDKAPVVTEDVTDANGAAE